MRTFRKEREPPGSDLTAIRGRGSLRGGESRTPKAGPPWDGSDVARRAWAAWAERRSVDLWGLERGRIGARSREVRVEEHDRARAALECSGAVGDAGIQRRGAGALRIDHRREAIAQREDGVAEARGLACVIDRRGEKLRARVRDRGRSPVGTARAEVRLHLRLRGRRGSEVRRETRLAREDAASVGASPRRRKAFLEAGLERRAEARDPCRTIRRLRLGAATGLSAAGRIGGELRADRADVAAVRARDTAVRARRRTAPVRSIR